MTENVTVSLFLFVLVPADCIEPSRCRNVNNGQF